MIYGIDAVHGHNNVQGATIFPHNIGLGATRDPALLEEMGRVVAQEIAATGIDWDFAPGVIVARDERWGRTYESYAEGSPRLSVNSARPSSAACRARRSPAPPRSSLARNDFLGDGGTTGGRDQGNTAS